MKLKSVKPGQEFILARDGKRYRHHGLYPPNKRFILTTPYASDPMGTSTLHMACEVEVIEQPKKRKLRYPQLNR